MRFKKRSNESECIKDRYKYDSHPPSDLPPSRSNLEDSVLIRNVLKSQRRERGDHTVLMNRDRGISSNLHLDLHLISLPVHTHSPSPLLSAFVFFSSQFPSQTLLLFFFAPFVFSPLPFCSPTDSLIIYFLSLFFPPFSLYSPVLRQCQRSIRQLCSGWRGWRPGAVPLSECLSSPRPSVCPPSPMVLN